MPKIDQCRHHVSLLIFVIISAVLVVGTANALPSYDLSVSSFFCKRTAAEPEDLLLRACAGFPAAADPFFRAIRQILFYVPPAALVLLVLDLSRTGLLRTTNGLERARHEFYAIAAYLLGVVLIVNMILKATSGRPRPHESLPFGGDMMFVPAGDFTGACTQNCSFVSGEAAAAGWLICLLPLIGGKYRRPITIALVAISVATPFLRVAMGGHFVSDVMLGWLVGAASFPMVIVAIATFSRISKGPSRAGTDLPT